MSKEIMAISLTGKTLYAAVVNSAGQWWNTFSAAFEAENDAHWYSGGSNNYAIALTEQGTTGVYVGDFPTAVNTAGRYHVLVYVQVGGTPALATDLPPAAAGDVLWNGTAEGFVKCDTSGKISEVTLCDTLTTYTGNTPQTGDAYGRIGVAGAGLTGVVLAAAGLNGVLVDGVALPKALQIIAAVTAGKITTAGQAQEIFVGLDGVTVRVTVTDDASGNRTAIVYNIA